MSIWVLVADRACARIFSPDLHSNELLEIEDFVHPESRLRRQDTVTDGPGRFEETAGGRHSG
ncbi:MAG: host attachment protein, partial [Planctomycetes bacterium]|nr:host attachment protein [Planctomycetota bacterium]